MKVGKTYRVKIKGINPLIFNVLKKEIEDKRKRLKKDELERWEEQVWPEKAEFDKDGNVIIPDRWLKACLVEACKKHRLVPRFATSKKQTYTDYVRTMMVRNTKPLCKREDLKPFGAFVGAQGKNSATKVWRIRPMVEEWDADFEITDPNGLMPIEDLKELLEYAGMFIGIGDNRVNSFGRFEVVSITEVK